MSDVVTVNDGDLWTCNHCSREFSRGGDSTANFGRMIEKHRGMHRGNDTPLDGLTEVELQAELKAAGISTEEAARMTADERNVRLASVKRDRLTGDSELRRASRAGLDVMTADERKNAKLPAPPPVLSAEELAKLTDEEREAYDEARTQATAPPQPVADDVAPALPEEEWSETPKLQKKDKDKHRSRSY